MKIKAPTASTRSMINVSVLRLVRTRSNICSMKSAGVSNSTLTTRLNPAADKKNGRKRDMKPCKRLAGVDSVNSPKANMSDSKSYAKHGALPYE